MSDYTPNKCDCGKTIYTEKQYSCDECFQTNRKYDLIDPKVDTTFDDIINKERDKLINGR